MRLVRSLKELNTPAQSFPVFFHDCWFDYLRETNANSQVYLCCDEAHSLVLPFIVHQLRFLKKAAYIYVPLLLDGNRPGLDAEKSFLEQFHKFLSREKLCDVIFPPLHCCVFKSIPSRAIYFEIGIIEIDMTGTAEDIFGKMNTTYRKQIRKAEKLGVSAHFGPETFSDFYKLYADTHSRQGLPHLTASEIKKLMEKMSGNILVGFSKTPAGTEHSNLSVYDKAQAYSFWGGSAASPVVPGSNKFLMWGSIKALKDLGVKKYILGGYRNPDINDEKHNGIQDFKLRFGADVEKGYHFIKIINPARYYLFVFALKIKSILKGKEYSFINTSGLNIRKSK